MPAIGALKCACTPRSPVSSSPLSAQLRVSSGESVQVTCQNLAANGVLEETYLAKGENRASRVTEAACGIAAETTAFCGREAAALGVAKAASSTATEATATGRAAAATRSIVVLAPGVVVYGGGHGPFAGIGFAGGPGGHWRRGLVAGAIIAGDSA